MVLSYFPKPYDGEILYSILARYQVRTGSLGIKEVIRDLFGSTNVSATVDLPSHIDALIGNLPHGFPLTAEKIINEHTLYPYYKPFLPIKQAEAVFTLMRGKGGGIHYKTGIMASVVSTPRYLRFCPACLAEQRKLFGEGFWHRLYQAPGLLVCAKHMLLIEDSRVHTPGINKHQYTSPNEDCCTTVPRIMNFNSKTLELLAQISRDVEWLLQARVTPLEAGGYQQHYIAYLIDMGLATGTGRVSQKEFGINLKGFYGSTLLKALDSDIDTDSDSHWIAGIVRKHRKSFHPIRHLLMMRFLAGSAEEFFSNLRVFSPFGDGPWPCLNAAANHYLEPVIRDFKLTHCADTKRPVGTFSCDCGFIYSRRGPDQTEADRFRIGRVKRFGHVWHERLEGLLSNKQLSFREIARILKVDTNTVRKYGKLDSQSNSSGHSISNTTDDAEQKGTVVIGAIAPEPNAETYNGTRVRRSVKVNSRVNWEERDQQVLLKVKTITNQILSSTDKPKRITVSYIGKQLGLLSLFEKKLDRLPLTKSYLQKVIETTEEYQVRRVKWAVNELCRKGERVITWKVKRLAGLKKNISPTVKRTINDQISTFNPNMVSNLVKNNDNTNGKGR